MISDAHEGLKAAIVRVLGATWQRCRVHWTRNVPDHVPKGQHTMVAAALRQRSSSRSMLRRVRRCCTSPR